MTLVYSSEKIMDVLNYEKERRKDSLVWFIFNGTSIPYGLCNA